MACLTNLCFLGLPGGGEIWVVLAIVLLIFGPKKIPELARGLGKGIKEFKKAKSDIHDAILSEDETEKKAETSKETPDKDYNKEER